MTSAAASSPRELGPIRRFFAWLSHYDTWLATVTWVVMIVMMLTNQTRSDDLWPIPIVLFTLTYFAWFGNAVHMRQPCARCVERFPLNAPEEAERRRAALRLVHRDDARAAAYSVLLTVIVAQGVFGFLRDVPLYAIVLLPTVAVSAYVSRVHRMLQPWCPWCRRRDDDDEDGEPELVPDPTPPAKKVDA